MKILKAVVLVATLSLSQAAYSMTTAQYEACDLMAKIAGKAMSYRQQDGSLEKVLKGLDGLEPATMLSLKAWEFPVFNTKEYKDKMVVEFARQYLVACYQEYTK